MGADSIYTDTPTRAEQLTMEIVRQFPSAAVTPLLGVVYIEIPGERGCVAMITAETVDIRLPTIEWTCGSYGPRRASRPWKRIRLPQSSRAGRKLLRAIEAALAYRQSEFKPCTFCKEEFPPESRTDDACHDCSSKHRQIVY
jgi:hypothetical protein